MIYRNGVGFFFRRRNARLKVACIFDPFTYSCFEPECDMFQITPTNWEKELYDINPDFVFIESAWQGKDDLWGGKLITLYAEIGALAKYCAEKFIPLVFWNKEDPYGYETFLNTARIADVILTTASECVEKYKNDLKHENVYFMHFAAQPNIHNPVEEYEREDKFCFAGAYYRQFPERIKKFDLIYNTLNEYKGVDIYDRFYRDKKRCFPKRYQKNVKGVLLYNEISKAYKGYYFGININTITNSDSMFARRVFELMASNTIVVGNYSKGLVRYFGDLTISSDNPDEIIQRLNEICKTKETFDEFRKKALDRVMSSELYSHRLEFICRILFTE